MSNCASVHRFLFVSRLEVRGSICTPEDQLGESQAALAHCTYPGMYFYFIVIVSMLSGTYNGIRRPPVKLPVYELTVGKAYFPQQAFTRQLEYVIIIAMIHGLPHVHLKKWDT